MPSIEITYEGGKVITRECLIVAGEMDTMLLFAHLRLGMDFPLTRRLLSGKPTSGSSTVADLGFFSTCGLLLRPKPKMSRPEEDFLRAPAPAPTLPPDPRRCLCATTLSESTLLLPATAPVDPVAAASTYGKSEEERGRKRIN